MPGRGGRDVALVVFPGCGCAGVCVVAVGLVEASQPMMFFTGMHQPCDAAKVPAAFVSIHRLEDRQRSFLVRRCIIDSGAFTTILTHGKYLEPPAVYARRLRYWANKLRRRLLCAVAQDYMCEPFILDRTGLTIPEHQRLTIERYDQLVVAQPYCRIMPVLQGYSCSDYLLHLKDYGDRLGLRHWVGVGSLCKRNGDPAQIEEVLLAIKRARSDLRLHGFGIKTTALRSALVRQLLFSADSMAWSFHARKNGRNPNSPREAVRFGRRIATMPVQNSLVGLWQS